MCVDKANIHSRKLDNVRGIIEFKNKNHKKEKMKLSSPKQITWIIALVLAILALLGNAGIIDALATYSFWLALAAAGLMLIATLVRDL